MEAGPSIELRDAKGRVRCSLGMRPEGSIVFELNDSKETARFNVEVDESLSMMSMLDADGVGLLTATVSSPPEGGGGGTIILSHRQGLYFEQIPRPPAKK